MMVAFREADRLWMLSPDGLKTDLMRKGIKMPSDVEIIRQFEHNLNRFKDERNLYDPSDGPFMDSETFFRTQEGREICQQYQTEALGSSLPARGRRGFVACQEAP